MDNGLDRYRFTREQLHAAIVEELSLFFSGTSVEAWVSLRASDIAASAIERAEKMISQPPDA